MIQHFSHLNDPCSIRESIFTLPCSSITPGFERYGLLHEPPSFKIHPKILTLDLLNDKLLFK